MTEAEHAELVEATYAGLIVIGVDRPYARKVFTDVPLARIQELTGEAPYFEKAVVWFVWIGSFLALPVSWVFAVLALGWWGLLTIPPTAVAWAIYCGCSPRGNSRLWLITVILVATVANAAFGVPESIWARLAPVAFIAALWLNRSLYVASTFFLRAMVLRNRRAWVAFSDGLYVRDVASLE